MKNKNIGECVLSTQPDQQKKSPMQKCAKNAKNYQTLKKKILVRFAHSTFYIIHISGAANRPAQFNMQNMLFFFLFFFFLFFLSSHHDTNPLLHLYHFRKKYNYILANINSESSRVTFSFFCLHPVGQTFLYPNKFCNHLKHRAK